jgi:hypothetical protein
MADTASIDFGALLDLRRLSIDELRERLGLPPAAITRGADYGPSDNLLLLHGEKVPGLFFYDREGTFLVGYVGRLDTLRPADLLERFGEPDESLRSRAGKHFLHHVFAGAGVAASWEKDADEVAVVEIFRPMSLSEYKDRIYEDPGHFRV